MRRSWPIIDEVTDEAGVVTSELVPAVHADTRPPDTAVKLAATPTGGGG